VFCGVDRRCGAAVIFHIKYLFPLLSFPQSLGLLLFLGISFFTFAELGYLVDCTSLERGRISYFLFVSFFPHLIAGSILNDVRYGPDKEGRQRRVRAYRKSSISVI
jgi:D-alanyl-lipoteichoic acid acyltransferase DltB (MBOAT superfamily)